MHFHLFDYLKNYVHSETRYAVRNFLRRKVQAQYAFEIARRSALPLGDIDALCADISVCPPELEWWNNVYGHGPTLKRFVGLPDFYPLKVGLQHGCQLGTDDEGMWISGEFKHPPVSLIWGENGKRTLLDKGKVVYSAGAPFFYAESLLSCDGMEAERKRLGKTLLVFPVHCNITDRYDVNFDSAHLVRLIEGARARLGFDTVRVCVFFADHQCGRSKIFQDAGFECVTAGHTHDPNFLRRLKALILCCDAVASNDFGSHLGYAIGSGKPFLYFPQKISLHEHVLPRFKQEFGEDLSKEFGDNLCITEQQRDFCDRHWGINCIKSRDQLLQIFYEAEDLWRSKRWYVL